MFPELNKYIEKIIINIDSIKSERKKILAEISKFIMIKRRLNLPVQLVYICTHNSRRSHFGQIWATIALTYYKIDNIYTFSGGTEVTSFNVNAVNALTHTGLKIQISDAVENPVYQIYYDMHIPPMICFSKLYYDSINPSKEFAAIMTCSEADENCPVIQGAEQRFSLKYEDPKIADNTSQKEFIYNLRCKQIATEAFYMVSLLK